MPQPTANHKWLKHFIGEWDTKTKMFMAPGQPPQLSEASQVVRPLGEFWVLSEYDGSFMNKPFQGIQTIGYDVNKGKYVATWTDNMTGYLWNYEGILDQAKNTLTMEAEGYCPMKPGKLTRFRDIIEMKTPDHMTYTSLMLDDNGQWVTMMTAESYRVDEESDAEQ